MKPKKEPKRIDHYFNLEYALYLEKLSDTEYDVWRKPKDYELAFKLRYLSDESGWRIYSYVEWFIPETIELLDSIMAIVVNELM